jgi:hypothetical protein
LNFLLTNVAHVRLRTFFMNRFSVPNIQSHV